jgi:hypothetical protein
MADPACDDTSGARTMLPLTPLETNREVTGGGIDIRAFPQFS